jgi:hypothetical protein
MMRTRQQAKEQKAADIIMTLLIATVMSIPCIVYALVCGAIVAVSNVHSDATHITQKIDEIWHR